VVQNNHVRATSRKRRQIATMVPSMRICNNHGSTDGLRDSRALHPSVQAREFFQQIFRRITTASGLLGPMVIYPISVSHQSLFTQPPTTSFPAIKNPDAYDRHPRNLPPTYSRPHIITCHLDHPLYRYAGSQIFQSFRPISRPLCSHSSDHPPPRKLQRGRPDAKGKAPQFCEVSEIYSRYWREVASRRQDCK
jgi:hypothetical protein